MEDVLLRPFYFFPPSGPGSGSEAGSLGADTAAEAPRRNPSRSRAVTGASVFKF